MDSERLDKVIELLGRIPPIIHRKIRRDLFKVVFQRVGEDIAPHHLLIMKVLEEEGVLHISEIGDMAVISKSQMTHSIDKLIRLGMIERQPDAKDRRRANIRLTEKGRTTVEEVDRVSKSLMRAKLSSLGDEELKKLSDSLNYIAEVFSKME